MNLIDVLKTLPGGVKPCPLCNTDLTPLLAKSKKLEECAKQLVMVLPEVNEILQKALVNPKKDAHSWACQTRPFENLHVVGPQRASNLIYEVAHQLGGSGVTVQHGYWDIGMRRVSFLVRSSREDGPCAFIVANITKQSLEDYGAGGENGFRLLLTEAVSDWLKNTLPGQKEWHGSNHDFNVGALSTCIGNATLHAMLEKRGIHDLTVEVFDSDDSCRNWTFDTVLHEENA